MARTVSCVIRAWSNSLSRRRCPRPVWRARPNGLLRLIGGRTPLICTPLSFFSVIELSIYFVELEVSLAQSLLCGISPSCAVGRRTLPGRALQRAANYFGTLPHCIGCFKFRLPFLLGGVKHIPNILPSQRGHPPTVLCYMSTIAVMCMPHLHRLPSDPNLILSETLTFSPSLASRALLQPLDVPSSSFLLVLILDLCFFCHKKMSTMINGITTTTKNYMYMRLGELLQSTGFFFGNITPSRCTNQKGEEKKKGRISDRK